MEQLTVQEVKVKFGKKEVLTSVSFSISAGEIVGLVGSNGSGKTTLMKAILGLTPKKAGVVSFHGEKLGGLIENPSLYPFLTGYEHLQLFSIKEKDEEIAKIVHRLDMNEFIHQKTKEYSLGMKQRLGVGIALLNHPQLVVLDEPMNGLDPKANKRLRETILTYAKEGTAFLISSHQLSELEKVVDRVLLLKDGVVAQDLQHSEMAGDAFEEQLLGFL